MTGKRRPEDRSRTALTVASAHGRRPFSIILAASWLSVLLTGCAASGDFLVLTGGRLYVDPDSPPIDDAVVVIRGERIAAVGPRRDVRVPDGARVIDCSGRTVLHAFTNSHVHLFGREWENASSSAAERLTARLEAAFTRFGFTSVFDLGSDWSRTRALRRRIETGEVAGPRLRSVGEAMVGPGAMPSDADLRRMGFTPFDAPEVTSVRRARVATRRLAAAGVHGIKIHMQPGDPTFPASAIPAVVAEAGRAGKPVFLHPHTTADALAASRSGVDVIAHTTPGSGPWDGETVAALLDRPVALTPTLSLWARYGAPTSRDRLVDVAVEQLRCWSRAGGVVLFGTDFGAVSADPTTEYVLMSRAGMSFRAILASLTTAPAAILGGPTAGRVTVGAPADLVVLGRDPSDDPRRLADVRLTIKDGRIVHARRGDFAGGATYLRVR